MLSERKNRTDEELVSSTEAKNEFGRILERVIRGDRIVITKHETAKAVLISIEEYDRLVTGRRRELGRWTEEFDRMLARMQEPRVQAGMRKAFGATPRQLGQVALGAARKRG